MSRLRSITNGAPALRDPSTSFSACLSACRSEPQIPHASVLTSASSGPGSGVGTLSTTSFRPRIMAARIADRLETLSQNPGHPGSSTYSKVCPSPVKSADFRLGLHHETNMISLSPMMIRNKLVAVIFAAVLIAYGTLSAGSAPDAVANSAQMLKLHDGRIAYDDSGGNGPIVICVPGLGDLRQQYRFLAPRLEAAGLRGVTMDLRGLGESSTDWPDYSAASVGADTVALSNHLGAKKVYVMGNSMAAAAAVWAAAESPGVVAVIVVIGPFVREMPPSALLNAFLKVAMIRPWGPSFWSMYYGSLSQ